MKTFVIGGRQVGKTYAMKNREYFNALLEANYYGQIIDEACNGNDPNNVFRRTMTIADCESAERMLVIWSNYAKFCKRGFRNFVRRIVEWFRSLEDGA